MKITKLAAGYYEATHGLRTVSIERHDHLNGWIASADWNRGVHSDPLPTMRRAVEVAVEMMNNKEIN